MKDKIFPLEIADYRITVKLVFPAQFQKALIIANGSGANMDSAFISNYAHEFARRDILTVRFNFHYQELAKKIPDSNEKCRLTYLAVFNFITQNYLSEEDIIIGGKSMGGRIATEIAAQVNCKKIVTFGYPLHPPGKPEKRRDGHLYSLNQRVLFIQGENDAFGKRFELEPVISGMKNARSFFVPAANHSLIIPKKANKNHREIENEILKEVTDFVKN